MSEHTPTLWRLKTEGNMGSLIEAYSGKTMHEFDDGYRTVASYQECCASDLYAAQEANRRANGAFIVKAVNNHAALVAIQKAAQDYFMCAVQDEADDDLECCITEQQHELAKALRDALRSFALVEGARKP